MDEWFYYGLLHETMNDHANEHKFNFCKLETNERRVEYCLQFFQGNNVGLESRIWKNNSASMVLRKKGNEQFAAHCYFEALEYFNQSVAFAETDETLSLAYGNRTACLFNMKLYEECLTGIDQALALDCTEALKEKLLKRKEKATKMLAENGQQSLPSVDVKIPDSEKNNFIQSASKALKIKTCEPYGRGIFAARDIDIGELLIVEQPYATLLSEENCTHCDHCCRLSYNLISCDKCRGPLYCGKECKNTAFKTYHKYECFLREQLTGLCGQVGTQLLLAFKLTIKALEDKEKVLGSDVEEENHRSDRYHELSMLSTSIENMPFVRLFAMSFYTGFFFNFLREYTTFLSDYAHIPDVEARVKDLLLFNLAMTSVNEVFTSQNSPPSKLADLGTAIYPLYSILNHSCNPNVFYYFIEDTLIVRSNIIIKKGEQCFTSYGPHYGKMYKCERQKPLLKCYHFTCACKPCTENWTLGTNYQFLNCQLKKSLKIIERLTKNPNRKAIEATLLETKENILKHMHKMPCMPVLCAQIILQDCLFLIDSPAVAGLEQQAAGDF